MQIFHRLILTVFATFQFIGFSGSTNAAEVLWDGGGTYSFMSNPINWAGGTLPQTGDSVRFDGTSPTNRRNLSNPASPASFNRLIIQDVPYTIGGTTLIELTGGITDNHGSFGATISAPLLTDC